MKMKMELNKIQRTVLFHLQSLLVLLLLSCVIKCSHGVLPEDYLPQIQILEIVSSPLNRSVAVNLWKQKNSDVVIGEDTSATSRILMKCNATYPVQWVYLGDGRPEFTTFTNVKWHDDPKVPLSFEAEASLGLLGFQGVLGEEDTGNYTCRSIQEPSVHSYYYVYVPGDGLFASSNGTNITYSPQDSYIRIPCGVSHPKASASLCKKDKDENLTCPVSGASAFNSKGGFRLNLKKQQNPSGTYVCTANYKRAVRIVEHHVMREGEKPKPSPPLEPPPTFTTKPGKNICDPSPCGKQAECSVVDGRAVCYCFRGLNGDPYDECAPGKCRSNKECPRGKFCRQGQCTSDPCNPSPCGSGSECTFVRGHSKCSCQKGFTGLPPNCVKACTDEDHECSEDEACIKNICQSPCPGPCGQHAECRVLKSGAKRTAQCSCPSGYLGDPLKSCFKFGANMTTPGPWNNCPPGYVGEPPACQQKECDSDLECPYGRKCLNNICDKGFSPSCPGKCGLNAECQSSPTTSDPICICPPETTGNPAVQCVPLSTVPTSWGDPCTPNPCQSPAQCHIVQGSRACVCPQGYTGDPSNCIPTTASAFPASTSSSIRCKHDSECSPGENCFEGRCLDLCNGLCGYNAICQPSFLRKYRSISTSNKLVRSQENTCSCPPGHEGNPYVSCIPIRTGPPPPKSPSSHPYPDPVCFPSPCARFADCSVVNNSPICACIPGYEGNPYAECRHSVIHRPPSNEPPPPMHPPGRVTPMSPGSDLDFQGHSWGHHTGGIETGHPLPNQPFHNSRFNTPPSPTSSRDDRHPHYHLTPDTSYSYPPPNYFDDDRKFHTEKVGSNHPTPNQLYPTNPYETPTPKTLNRPMSPLAPLNPPPDVRDECTFRNPYADYDMDSCGVGRRCERDFRGIKRCVCISPFDCTGPTSTYSRGQCQTSRDCLLSDHVCINGTCGNPCSPEFSPCAGIAFTECRVIEGNVLCTCRRGYVGSPASGLDCRPKRSPAVPSGNNSHGVIENIHFNFHPALALQWNITNKDSYNYSDSNSTESDDIVISAGSTARASNHQRRHDNHHQIGIKEISRVGQCGFGSGQYCDEKSHCRVVDDKPMCVCKAGYRGEFPHCKPECEKNEDCPENMACQYHQCMDPCIEEKLYCAPNAVCRVNDHTAGCECEGGYEGVPWIQCKKIGEATGDCMGFNCKKNKGQ